MAARAGTGRNEWRRRLLPAATVVAGSMAMTTPLPMAWSAMPNFAMLLVLIWASVQPRLMPVWAAFLLGLVHDIITASPLGLFGLIFALITIAVRVGEGRLRARSMAMDWLFVSALVAMAHALFWLLLPLAGLEVAPGPIMLQALTTALCFPPMLAIAALLHRRLIDQGA